MRVIWKGLKMNSDEDIDNQEMKFRLRMVEEILAWFSDWYSIFFLSTNLIDFHLEACYRNLASVVRGSAATGSFLLWRTMIYGVLSIREIINRLWLIFVAPMLFLIVSDSYTELPSFSFF